MIVNEKKVLFTSTPGSIDGTDGDPAQVTSREVSTPFHLSNSNRVVLCLEFPSAFEVDAMFPRHTFFSHGHPCSHPFTCPLRDEMGPLLEHEGRDVALLVLRDETLLLWVGSSG